MFFDDNQLCSNGPVNPSISGPQPGVIYYIDDHLGSSDLVTDSLGNILSEESRYPYGLERQVNGEGSTVNGESVVADYVYTGKEYDVETGLIYFGGRYYAPELGRWITPDPLFLEKEPKKAVEMPLSSNLYAYVRNNPMTYVDETGNLEGYTFELNQRDHGEQYRTNIESGPWSEQEAVFQKIVGSGLVVMAAAPAAAAAWTAVAPVVSEAVFSASVTAYTAQTAVASAAAAETGLAVGALKSAGISVASFAVTHPQETLAFGKGVISGYVEQDLPYVPVLDHVKPSVFISSQAGGYVGGAVKSIVDTIIQE